MRKIGAIALWMLAACGLAAGTTNAQSIQVGTGDEGVTLEGLGKKLRVKSGDTSVTVSGDWREGHGTLSVGEVDVDALLRQLGAVEVDGRIRLQLAGDILFDFDSTAIREDAAATLAEVAEVIRKRSVGDVYVVGHTDSKGKAAYNQRLSEARAQSVVDHLSKTEGIPAAIMSARGVAARQPVAENTLPDGRDNPKGRAKNRRVEVHFATTEEAARVGIDLDALSGLAGAAAAATTARMAVEGATGSAQVVSDEQPAVCPAGGNCDLTCRVGDCEMTCAAGAHCDFACPGGDCTMTCAAGAHCRFGCGGGDCSFTCAGGSNCATSCGGDDCTCDGGGC